ncbi:MAG: hypothetical protein PHG66_06855 [Candidatus Colwellbacteria bacterium]|nr:hypothetical protein [Candidatus Colwellbacteria bacterium]
MRILLNHTTETYYHYGIKNLLSLIRENRWSVNDDIEELEVEEDWNTTYACSVLDTDDF